MNFWKCPNCKRKFSRFHQHHRCEVHTIEEYFKDKSEKSWILFTSFMEKTKRYGIRFESISWAITISTKKQIGMIFALDEGIKLELKLSREIKSDRVLKNAKMGNLFVHVFIIKNTEEIDQELLNWVKNSIQDSSS